MVNFVLKRFRSFTFQNIRTSSEIAMLMEIIQFATLIQCTERKNNGERFHMLQHPTLYFRKVTSNCFMLQNIPDSAIVVEAYQMIAQNMQQYIIKICLDGTPHVDRKPTNLKRCTTILPRLSACYDIQTVSIGCVMKQRSRRLLLDAPAFIGWCEGRIVVHINQFPNHTICNTLSLHGYDKHTWSSCLHHCLSNG